MYNFKLRLVIGDDVSTGLPVFGFNANDRFIHDPFRSECGHFMVDPTRTYVISGKDAKALVALNQMLHEATQAGLNEACFTAQKHLGIDAGDFAGVYFSGPEHVYAIAQTMAQYILREIERADDGLVG